MNTLKALILTAPEHLRAQFRSHPTPRQVRTAPGQSVSQQHLRQLATQITGLDTELTASLRYLRSLVWV